MSRDRLELIWPGKYDEQGQLAVPQRRRPPLRERERFGAGAQGRLVLGDNLDALDALGDELEGRVDLVYADPPFGTGQRFAARLPVGSNDERAELPAYVDRWPGGAAGLVAMLAPRLQTLHRLLAPSGSLYLHVDPHVGHPLKLLLDEIFGAECFQREIVWRMGWISGFKSKAKNWVRNHDLILFYVKDPNAFTFNKHYIPYPEGYRRRDGQAPTGPGVPMSDVWNADPTEFELRGRESMDSIQIKSFSREKTGWATQKNESVLERIVKASSNEGDLVLDPFGGSGTTAVVAHRLGRRFVSLDASPVALAVTRHRLLHHGCEDLLVADVEAEAAHSGGRVAAAWREGTEGWRVELEGLEYETDADVPDELRSLEPCERVEAWTIAPLEAPTRPSHWAQRVAQVRELDLAGPAVGRPRDVVVHAWDVRGVAASVELSAP